MVAMKPTRAGTAMLVLTVVALAACSSTGAAKPQTIRAAGTVTVTDPTDLWPDDDSNYTGDTPWPSPGYKPGAGCHTLTGYPDIATGAQAVITDDSGHTLAIAHLTAGTYDADGGCAFRFAAMVPAGKKFYGFTVTHRGTVKEPEAKIGAVALTLGT